MKKASHALIIRHNNVIECVGSELEMIVQRARHMRLFTKEYNYWTIQSLTAEQLENYYKREPGELAIYDSE